MPRFIIEQVALCPPDRDAAIELLQAMGAEEWANDLVEARGHVFNAPSQNKAQLSFNYSALKSAYELEILNYVEGRNWMAARPLMPHRVSHFGMHCTAEELAEWREFFAGRGIEVAQEVMTIKHTNPVIDGTRWYQYVIFNTFPILGVDVKFIVRRDSREA